MTELKLVPDLIKGDHKGRPYILIIIEETLPGDGRPNRKRLYMPTAFAHTVSAIAITKVAGLKLPTVTWSVYLIAIICAVIPDADVLAFKFGISYHDILGHRGWTHSIGFSVLIGLFFAFLFYRKRSLRNRLGLALLFAICALSHPILDAMTSGGLGVALYWPFSEERIFFDHRPILVSPIGIKRFFSAWGWKVMQSEFYYVWIPSIVVFLGANFFELSKSTDKERV